MNIETKCLRCGISIFRSEAAIKYRPEKSYCKECLKQIKKETLIKKHGSLENFYTQRNQKTKETNIKKYGTENPWALDSVKDKRKQACLEKYNSTSPFTSQKCMQKAKDTLIKSYGVEHPAQSKEVLKKMKQTCIERFGVEHYGQTAEAASHRHTVCSYNGLKFDSKDELRFYKKCKLLNLQITRCDLLFEYFYEGKKHFYNPDFIVNGILFEVKGSQFLNEDGTWKNPYCREKDGLYEAKRLCAIKNKVNIIYDKDIEDFNFGDYLSDI